VSDDWWWGGSFLASSANLGGTFDTDCHVFVKRYDGSAARLYIDGEEVAPNSPGTTAFNFASAGVGFNTIDGANGAPGTPKLFEMIWFPTDITSEDQGAIEADMAEFFSL